jgi:hypothetical protein
MTLLSVSPSSMKVGSIITSFCAPDFKWKKCDGSVLLQADYPNYVAGSTNFELHPQSWSQVEFENNTVNLVKLCKKGTTIIATPLNSRKVFYSTDSGDTWQLTGDVLPSSGYWSPVVTNGTIFVALRSGSNAGAYSSDGISWTGFTAPATVNWKFLGWNGTVFIASSLSGANCQFYYSSDGYNWNTGATFGSDVSVMCGGCANCDSNGYFVFYSTDYKFRKTNNGTSFSVTSNPFYFCEYTPEWLNYFVFLNGKWWVGDNNSFPFFITSSDAFDTVEMVPVINMALKGEYFYQWYGNVYTGEEIIFFDGSGYSNWLSPDGINFYARNSLFNAYSIDDAVFVSKEKGIFAIYNSGLSTETTYVRNKLGRLKYTHYDYTTHFQLPRLLSNMSGMGKYIKVK